MKKNACCFCDITGTLIGKNKNTSIDYETLNNILLEAKQKMYSDFILFSLISTDHKEAIIKQQEILSKYLDQLIHFGRQFFENGYIDNQSITYQDILGKPFIINQYVEELEKKYFIQKIYFIDDCEMYHQMLSFFAEYYHWEKKLYSIIPKEKNGLSEVNKLLKKEITK